MEKEGQIAEMENGLQEIFWLAFASQAGPATVIPIILFALFWTALYVEVTRVNRKGLDMGPEWNCRTVALFHGILSVVMSAASSFGWGPWPLDLDNLALPNTPYQILVLQMSMGFFAFDFMWCIKHGESFVVFAHHFTTLFASVLSMWLGSGGTPLVATIFGSEVSNPMLQMRWFYLEMIKHHPAHPSSDRWRSWVNYNEWYFVFVYTVARIGFGPYLLYLTVVSEFVPVSVKLGGFGAWMISLGWWTIIVKKMVRRLRGSTRGKPRKVLVAGEKDDVARK